MPPTKLFSPAIRRAITCCAVLIADAGAVDAEMALRDVIKQIRPEVKTERAMGYVRDLYASDRLFTFPSFQRTAEYLRNRLREIGLSGVELLSAPADGSTQYGFWTMPLAWDAKRARLEIVEPAVPAELRVLADYPKIPTSLGMWSGPTPPGGVTAEIVEMATDSPVEAAKIDMKGKLVLTRFNLLGLTTSSKWLLVKGGALGAINAFTENPSLRDGRHWVNFWGDSGWAFTKTSTPLLCFSVTPNQTELLHKQLAGHRRVRVHAAVESRYYSGTYPYVTAVLPGTDAGEEVLELGHTAEQGANDNATGVAAMVESLATLNRLIGAGKLPRPRRGIRILAMGELYPTMHYLAKYPERVRKTVAAICLDTAAAPYELPGTEYRFRLNPDVARSYIDALILRVAGAYFPALSPPRRFSEEAYGTGTDNFLPDPAIGIPTVWPTSGTGVHTHHNSEDTPARVDPRSLRDLTTVTAAFLYYIASADEPEARWLAEITASRASETLSRETAKMAGEMETANNETTLGRLLHRSVDRIGYLVDRETQAVQSVLRLVPAERRASVEESLANLIDPLKRLARERSVAALEDAANRRASALGLARPLRAVTPAANAQTEAAARIVVKRKRFGPIPMDDLPVERWEGYPYSSWALVPVTALYWCDGHRNLAEVVRLTSLEHDTSGFDFVGYFRFLAKHGYVELRER